MKKTNNRPFVHFLAHELRNLPHPVTVNVIGAGGTGSHVVTLLADTSYVLNELGHPGFYVTLYDDDKITQPNIGKQRFSPVEVGMYKAEAIIGRINRYYGYDWTACVGRYCAALVKAKKEEAMAQITISCVDEVAPRFEINKILRGITSSFVHAPRKPLYWIDCGNANYTGQVILSTVGRVKQPDRMKGCQTVSYIPSVTEQYGHLLVELPDTPSCSTWEALQKQDLFINRSVATTAVRMLRELLIKMQIVSRGCVINHRTGQEMPIQLEAYHGFGKGKASP